MPSLKSKIFSKKIDISFPDDYIYIEKNLKKKEGAPMMSDKITDMLLSSRTSFEVFKSNICHLVKDMGDIPFILDTLRKDRVSGLYQLGWYPEAFYLLAMVDHLSIENKIPICSDYAPLRCQKLKDPIYPAGTEILDMAMDTDTHTEEAIRRAIPEFARFNIIECEVRDTV